MKKSKIIIIILLISLFLNSCALHYTKQGLEEFSADASDYGLCRGLIPENFIEKFSYVKGDFFIAFSEKAPFIATCERVLLYLKYTDDVYLDAKKYAMENLILSENCVAVFENYIFYNNITPVNFEQDHLDGSRFPRSFVRFAYNDENNTLLFIGFDVSMELYDEVDSLANDWGAFLEKYYGEFYDFS